MVTKGYGPLLLGWSGNALTTGARCRIRGTVTAEDTFPSDLLDWADENLRKYPWRNDDATPYEVIVAEMFLAVTRTQVVAKVYDDFIDRFPTPEALRQAEREELVDIIRPLGMYNRRADALLNLAEHLEDGSVPDTYEELRELPRIGRYTANAVLAMAHDQHRPMLDRNVERVYTRLFGDDAPTDPNDEEAWRFAETLVPPEAAKTYNLGLIDFASTICTASNPSCEACFASEYCTFYTQQQDEDPD